MKSIKQPASFDYPMHATFKWNILPASNSWLTVLL